MRAEQKIIMSCRQTSERAERLLEWLDQSRMMLKSQSHALRIEVQGVANELLTLVEAVEQPPTAGLVGAWGSAEIQRKYALIIKMQMDPSQTPEAVSAALDALEAEMWAAEMEADRLLDDHLALESGRHVQEAATVGAAG